jgi:hypothetical protein
MLWLIKLCDKYPKTFMITLWVIMFWICITVWGLIFKSLI